MDSHDEGTLTQTRLAHDIFASDMQDRSTCSCIATYPLLYMYLGHFN